MSTAVIPATCSCGSIGRSDLRLCLDHHRYFRGDKELVSVSRVIRETWPIKPDFSAAPPDVLEHARERGIRVDRYFSDYLREGRVVIAAGEWEEVRDLTRSLVTWINGRNSYRVDVDTQMILSDEEVAGTCDVIIDGVVADLKTVHDVEPSYALQLGAYADLYEATYGQECNGIGIIHVHKRFKEPRWIPLDLDRCRRNWRTLRAMWRMVQELTA